MSESVFSLPPLTELPHQQYDTRFDTSQIPDNITQDLNMKSDHVDALWACAADHIPFHTHNFYEIISCRNTCGVEYMVGIERYRVQRGDVIFIPPGVSHCPIFPEPASEPFSRDMLWVHSRTVRILTENFACTFPGGFAEPIFFRTTGTHWEFIPELFQVCVQEARGKDANYEMAVMAYTMTILTHLCRARQDSLPMRAEQPELLNQVLSYIEEHLAERITLTDVSKAFFISQSTITQTFRKKMGISFYRCVTQRRLVAAKALIVSGVPLESVAVQVGFSDYSSFFRAFKQEMGVSPRQYRKLYNGTFPE